MMMDIKKYKHEEEVNKVIECGMKLLKENEVDVKTDEFTIVQQYDDGQAIIIRLIEDSDRKLQVDVLDTVVSLPKKDGTLDVFC